jgi:hypothetical protein
MLGIKVGIIALLQHRAFIIILQTVAQDMRWVTFSTFIQPVNQKAASLGNLLLGYSEHF